ncbi:cleavage stimulation factor subunit 3-like [Sinocyclocheilus rhinocerous]|uniref:cleavage stimulation factor subunit 3-like n=1 Tax=Sinocyclocheilus rhinocerous TaxID=307959 RepID=UPI0007B81509|nr:PREDICTED: cleavage stimulation factor subunit 3-like [Sinocyclocheilus rhinocerous]
MSTETPPDQAAEYIPEKVKKAEKKLEENPYDLDAWSILIREAQNQPIDKARKTYERLVAQFPSSGRFWKLYIEAEIKAKNYDKVEKLFQRCLMKVLHIDLWKCYLSYVRETKGKLPSYKEKMAQAYDFALDKIGMEIMSYQIWVDYINFLKGVEAVGSYAENQRITAVRRVYQRGCVNPMINIEQLWRDYSKYEEGINVHLAKKMIEDRSRDYMNARRVAKEYETVMKGLDRNAPSVPPQNSPQEAQQVGMWKKYIQWEKSNPLRTEDQTLITKRVMFAYEQCLLVLGHHPDVWYEAAQYLEQSSKLLAEKGDMNNAKLFSDEAANIYERAIGSLLKKNMLLYFSFADYEESRMKHEKVHSIYNRFLAIEDIDPTLVYIQYMKFARRAEGIKSGRTIFKKAREDPRTRHHVYVTAALMEYYCSKDKSVAFKIFELGLKKYGDIPEYILAYIDYLSHLNEDNNTRVLFERVLMSGSLSPEKSGEIWARFLAFESNIGDLTTAPGLHPVPGGVFPVPTTAVILMKLLPPPSCFTGPFVQVDELMESLRRCVLPETVDAAVELITGKQFETSSEGNGPVENHAVANKSLKRPNADSDEEEDKGSIAPPIHDIYRARQQKRIR